MTTRSEENNNNVYINQQGDTTTSTSDPMARKPTSVRTSKQSTPATTPRSLKQKRKFGSFYSASRRTVMLDDDDDDSDYHHGDGDKLADFGAVAVDVTNVNNKKVTTGPTTEPATIPIHKRHRYLLYFLNPETEQRYYDFQYVDTLFVPGKMFALVWVGYVAGGFFLLTAPFNDSGAYMIESFTDPWWSCVYISTAINTLLFFGLFINALKAYREHIHLAQVFFGWPTLIIVTLLLKRPDVFHYGFLCGTVGFSMLIVQARVCRGVLFSTLWPIICMFVVTFSVPEYWGNRTYIEMMYWPAMFMPLALLFNLEQRVRQSFVDKELAMKVIEEIEHKTAVTQKMIANFFPATPTRDLLQQLNGPRDKAYPNTALIVTDIAGFTAYTSRSDPTDVIEMLTVMFQAFDNASPQYKVEKIATVGDSYCGAVFPCPGSSNSTRCTYAIGFACSALPFAGFGLQLRVGVHIGNIVGVFVGCVPPKFDLFGPGIDHARIMEEEGRPGFVHISTAVLDALPTRPSSIFDTTPKGVLCTIWEEEAFTNTNVFDLHNDNDSVLSYRGDDDDDDVIVVVSPQRGGPLDSGTIVKALCAFSNLNPVVTTGEGGDGAASATPQTMSMAGTHQNTDALSVTSHGDTIVNDEEEGGDEFAFHRLFLAFKTKSLERRYKAHVQESGINDYCSKVLVAFATLMLIIQLNVQCGTPQDFGAASGILGILLLMCMYLLFIGTKHKYHFWFTCAIYTPILPICELLLTVDCDGLDNRSRYLGNSFSTFTIVAIYSGQYCLDVPLIHRTLSCVFFVVVFVIGMIIRNNTYSDDVLPVDPLPLCGLFFVILSFFPDYSLRTAFRTELQLRKLRKTARSKGAAMATSALAIMLPTFVTERIVELSREAARNKAPTQAQLTASETHTNTHTATHSATHTTAVSDEVADLDINAVAATWEYSHAVLMFVKFHSNHPSFTPAAINAIVQSIERIMTQFEVMKVKTIGSTVMLVSGIDDPRTRQEQLTGVVDAAIMIRASVFPYANVDGLTYRIGIHSGPCFGAVIGGNGAIFDLFGDTVNTASRMCSTAAVDSIQVSTVANGLILPRLREFVDPLPAVHMKGKGVMEVFGIRADADADSLLVS